MEKLFYNLRAWITTFVCMRLLSIKQILGICQKVVNLDLRRAVLENREIRCGQKYF